ncbi:hypothetical protein AZSI13_29170 [Azospira sp. I13]|uniref:DUF2917 domain-containing protein n=1 Tax=Azospira sp. I13 TaxID=1765050 RepID=UPI000D4EFB5D|nr:DUF2917 domain-containing protein [Azospira sp. I13]GBG03590.1 hypothetical protein AZSI13_29170 [Azospira sp. I13]
MIPILQGRATARWLHLELERREMLVLADARGQTLECRQGELWLTEAGGGDTILRAGERYGVETAGCLVISACQDSRLAVGGTADDPAALSLMPVRGFLAALLPWELQGHGR